MLVRMVTPSSFGRRLRCFARRECLGSRTHHCQTARGVNFSSCTPGSAAAAATAPATVLGMSWILEVEKYADAKLRQLANSLRPFRSEQLHVDFEKPDEVGNLAGQRQGLAKCAKVQCYY